MEHLLCPAGGTQQGGGMGWFCSAVCLYGGSAWLYTSVPGRVCPRGSSCLLFLPHALEHCVLKGCRVAQGNAASVGNTEWMCLEGEKNIKTQLILFQLHDCTDHLIVASPNLCFK